MLSFVRPLGTVQGNLNFYVNELSGSHYLISVVDRKNKTHLLYFQEGAFRWPGGLPIDASLFWTKEVQAALHEAIREEEASVRKAARKLSRQSGVIY